MILNIGEKELSAEMEVKRCAAIAILGDKWLLHPKNGPTRGSATIEALRGDAARYRWLRDTGDKTHTPFTRTWNIAPEMVDNRVDEAISNI